MRLGVLGELLAILSMGVAIGYAFLQIALYILHIITPESIHDEVSFRTLKNIIGFLCGASGVFTSIIIIEKVKDKMWWEYE